MEQKYLGYKLKYIKLKQLSGSGDRMFETLRYRMSETLRYSNGGIILNKSAYHTIKEIGDGNCLFRALARAKKLSDDSGHIIIRKQICDYLKLEYDNYYHVDSILEEEILEYINRFEDSLISKEIVKIQKESSTKSEFKEQLQIFVRSQKGLNLAVNIEIDSEEFKILDSIFEKLFDNSESNYHKYDKTKILNRIIKYISNLQHTSIGKKIARIIDDFSFCEPHIQILQIEDFISSLYIDDELPLISPNDSKIVVNIIKILQSIIIDTEHDDLVSTYIGCKEIEDDIVTNLTETRCIECGGIDNYISRDLDNLMNRISGCKKCRKKYITKICSPNEYGDDVEIAVFSFLNPTIKVVILRDTSHSEYYDNNVTIYNENGSSVLYLKYTGNHYDTLVLH